ALGAPPLLDDDEVGAGEFGGGTPLRVIDWVGLRVMRLPPAAVGVVAAWRVARLATRVCGNWIVSRAGSNPAIVSGPKAMSGKAKRVGTLACPVSVAAPVGAVSVTTVAIPAGEPLAASEAPSVFWLLP